jgi:hypothetical protein
VPFTKDLAAVRQAYEDRYALVRRYEVGNYGDRASALMAELSDAFKCLTNEHHKSQYDQLLYETLAARETRADIAMPHDTLVDQINELEQIVASDLQDNDPLGVAALTNSEDWVSMPVSAASSYLATSAVGPQMEAAGKREVAIPVWLAALCTCGAALFVIGAIAIAINVLGSRDDRDPVAIAPEAPSSAVDHTDVSPPVSGSANSVDTANSSGRVEWSGRLARVLVDEAGTMHLLVVSSNRFFEARTKDRDLIEQLSSYVCWAEDAELPDDVKVAGTFIDEQVSFFDPDRHLRGNQNEFAVLELQSLDLVENTRGGDDVLTAEEGQTLRSLRSVGRYTTFVATIGNPLPIWTSPRFQASFHDRDFVLAIPATWQALGAEIRQGQTVSVVARTVGSYTSSTGGGGIDDMLLLEVETIGQPSFEHVVQSPTQFVEKTLTYQATLRSTLLTDEAATLGLAVQYAGKRFSITGSAGIFPGQDTLLETIDASEPLLVELKVANADAKSSYEVISLTRLNNSTNRITFNAIAPDKPEPMPLAETSAPKPKSELTLAELPDYVDLPPVTSQTVEPLAPAVAVAELEIEFVCDLIALTSSYGFVAKQVENAEPLQWEIFLQKTLAAGTHEELVAYLAVEDNQFLFHWADSASTLPAGQLRNCLLQLKAGGESHFIALRSPVRSDATPLLSGEDRRQIEFELSDLPNPEWLRLDVDVSHDGSSLTSSSRTNTTTRGKRLDFEVDALQDVEIQVALLLQPDKSLILQALPRYQLSPNRQIALGTEEVDDLEQRIRQSGVKAERSLAKAQITLQEAQNALSQASNSATRAKCAATVVTQSKAVAANQKSIWEIQQTLNSVPALRSLVNAVHSNTSVRYRIYAEANETRLLLVDGEYQEAEARKK